MAVRKFDAAALSQMVNISAQQEVIRGVQKSSDPNFPVFGTPVDENVLMYFPRTNMITGENGSTMGMLKAVLHDYQKGKSFGTSRCLKGLTGEIFDQMELGYDGDCPWCEALAECWELYNLKLKKKIAELQLDPNNEEDPTLKALKTSLIGEMPIKSQDEYVTFPIVIIPKDPNSNMPAKDAEKNMKAYFVVWRKQRYEEKLLPALQSLASNPGHPAGLVLLGKYVYDAKGKKPNARDAAHNATYMVLQEQNVYKPLLAKAEELAKDFTLTKAAEVIYADQFQSKADVIKLVNSVMQQTRNLLAVMKAAENSATPAAPALSGEETALKNFGVTTSTQNLGTVSQDASAQATPAVPGAPVQAPAQGVPAVPGAPVQFGD